MKSLKIGFESVWKGINLGLSKDPPQTPSASGRTGSYAAHPRHKEGLPPFFLSPPSLSRWVYRDREGDRGWVFSGIVKRYSCKRSRRFTKGTGTINKGGQIWKHLKITISLFALLIQVSVSFGQQIPDSLHSRITNETWKAQWITHPMASQVAYGMYHFRNSFDLAEKPAKQIVHVTADNRYRLYVNGEPVTLGPAWGDLLHWRFESVDIAPYLKKGRNVVAAEVINFGDERPVSQMSYRTGFLLQADGNVEHPLNTNLDNWKVIKNKAYHPIHIDWRIFPYYYAASPTDTFEVARHPWGWKQQQYDDSAWLKPAPVGYNRKGTPRWGGHGFGDQSGWLLVPRPIPLLEETKQRFDHMERSVNVEINEDFLRGDQTVTLPANSKIEILLDHSVHTRAYPELRFSHGAGSTIKMEYAEGLVDEDQEEGNRDITEGKQMLGYYDIVLPDGGTNRLYRPSWLRVFRYVELQIETGDQPLKLHDFYSVYTAYPFKKKARFSSDQPELAEMLEAGWRTVRNATGEVFEDGPYYEQLMYAGDARIASLIALYVSGDDRMTKNVIDLFDNSRMPEGLTYSRYPSNQVQINPQYSLSWILMIHDHFMHSRDPDFAKNYLRGMDAVLSWFEPLVDSTGMLGEVPFLKHIEAKSGTPRHPERGHSAQQTLLYALALDRAADMFEYFGRGEKAWEYRGRSAALKRATKKLCYDPQGKLFADTPRMEVYTQHANVLAVLNELVTDEQSKSLMQKVLQDTSLVQARLFFKFYVFRAMDKAGLGDQLLDQLEPWRVFLDNGLTTFPEVDLESRSDAHPWSAHPAYFLFATVAGIKPVTPGFTKIEIAPHPGELKQIDGSMPHPNGEIKVKLKRDDKQGISGEVIIPEHTKAEFVWREQRLELDEGFNKIDLKKF